MMDFIWHGELHEKQTFCVVFYSMVSSNTCYLKNKKTNMSKIQCVNKSAELIEPLFWAYLG